MNRTNKISMWFGAVSLVMAAGCSIWPVGEDYKEIEMNVPETVIPDAGYPMTNMTSTGEFDVAKDKNDVRVLITTNMLERWWDQFNDPILTKLVESAITNNISFQIAHERLLQARWQLVGSAADFFPKVSFDGSYTRSGSHKNNTSRYSSGRAFHGDSWNSGFDASWEIDVFGGQYRQYKSSRAQMEAAEFELIDAWVRLTAEIGRQYISLRTVQSRIEVARFNLLTQSETYEILKSRLDSGIGDELAVNQARYNVEQTRASIPNLLASEESLKNGIAILVGSIPGTLHDTLRAIPKDQSRDWLVSPQKLESIPLDVIRARPDVRNAERKFASQVEAVGFAKSKLFPKFFINGSFGLDSAKANKFFSSDSFIASIGPSFSWPIFQGGNIYANWQAEQAKMAELALNYELSIQKAYEETRNAYSEYTQEYHRYQSLQGAVDAARAAVEISNDLYKNGLRDFNNVLDAQRSLLALEEALTISRGEITIGLISLYKSLGGGMAMQNL